MNAPLLWLVIEESLSNRFSRLRTFVAAFFLFIFSEKSPDWSFNKFAEISSEFSWDDSTYARTKSLIEILEFHIRVILFTNRQTYVSSTGWSGNISFFHTHLTIRDNPREKEKMVV